MTTTSQLPQPTVPLRLGTWNLERARGSRRRERQLAVLRDREADIWILTETDDAVDLRSTHVPVHSSPRPDAADGERWVTIWSRYPVAELVATCDASRTVAAEVAGPTGPLLIYGTVLPWHSDRGQDPEPAPNWSEHHRLIPEQGGEWRKLAARRPNTPLIVAGDLNTQLGGSRYYGTARGQALLRVELLGAGLVCLTEAGVATDALVSHPLIDHICVSGWSVATAVIEAWEGTTVDGMRLSDHSGAVATVDLRPKA